MQWRGICVLAFCLFGQSEAALNFKHIYTTQATSSTESTTTTTFTREMTTTTTSVGLEKKQDNYQAPTIIGFNISGGTVRPYPYVKIRVEQSSQKKSVGSLMIIKTTSPPNTSQSDISSGYIHSLYYNISH